MTDQHDVFAGPIATDEAPSASLTGRVHSATRPLSGVTLTLTDGVGSQISRVISGEDGRFRFDSLRPGHYILIARRPGYEPHAVSVTATIFDRTGSTLIDVELKTIRSITGIVHDTQTGRPVPAAAVLALDPAGEVIASTMSDPDGRYRLDGIATTTVTIAVATPGAEPVARVIELGAATGSDHVVDLPVQTLGILTGTVTAAGQAVPGITLHLHDQHGRTVDTTVTDDHGAYRFDNVPAGRYSVRSATSLPHAAAIGAHDAVSDVTLTGLGDDSPQ
ncbi:MSCRAMM family protein [Pseudonocardia sp. CA-142604]|uniref:MSCRAMM family protein n=1 Tax=Pseudonocardia sp. CA-142604 TaxID=3240024 RepID=UPI003D8AC6D8